MKKLIFTIILFAAAFILKAQNITNINAVQQGNTIVVFYDLDADANIALTVSLNGGKNFIDLTEVTGDVGNSIKAGKEKKIYWNAMEEIGFTNVEKMIFHVNAASHSLTTDKEEVVYKKGRLYLMNRVQKQYESGKTYNSVDLIKLSNDEVMAMMVDNEKSDVYYDYYLKGMNQKRNGKIALATGGVLIVTGIILTFTSEWYDNEKYWVNGSYYNEWEGYWDYRTDYDNPHYDPLYIISIAGAVGGGVVWAIFNSSGNKKIKKSAVLYNSSKKTSNVYVTPARSGLGVCINF